MRKRKFQILLFTALILVFHACSDEETDTQSPLIEVSTPTDDQEFHPGEEIPFNAMFTDNIALSQFRIDIHYGGDHDHKSLNLTNEGIQWTFDFIGELTGNTRQVQMDIPIPEDALHGFYHFLVYCTDIAGNESWIALEIIIDDEVH